MSYFIAVCILLFVFVCIRKATSARGVDNGKKHKKSYSLQQEDRADAHKPRGEGKWYPPGKAAKVQEYVITGGLIYVGNFLRDQDGENNDYVDCLIIPKLATRPADPWEGGEEMSYWPRYRHLSPRCRGAYLKWLAGGREEAEANIGYVFLFFYGLERRLFLDGKQRNVPESERISIVQEVERLLSIYGGNRSFDRYANQFLSFQAIQYGHVESISSTTDLTHRHYLQSFLYTLAKCVAKKNPIPAYLALAWLHQDYDTSLKTPARRCAKEFAQLFTMRYEKKYGEGIIVKPNKKPLVIEYHPASSSFDDRVFYAPSALPDPSSLQAPLNKLRELATSCTIELEPYSRFLARNTSDPDSYAAISLLPKELLELAPQSQAIKAKLAQLCLDGLTLLSTEALFALLENPLPTKIGKKEAENLASALEQLGFVMAPDVRHHPAKPNIDGSVVIGAMADEHTLQPTTTYRRIATILHLGAVISQIDGDIAPAETEVLQKFVHANEDISPNETQSLLAFLHWCLNTPQGLGGIKQRVEQLNAPAKKSIGHVLISVALADGVVDASEIKQLEKIYTALGLDKTEVASDIHARKSATAPIRVHVGEPEKAYSIPPPPATEPASFSLNEELVRIRVEETEQVKSVLEEIFAEEEDLATEQLDSAAQRDNPLASLDDASRALFHILITQEQWDRSKLFSVCQEQGMMLDGALEIMNEWSFNCANAPLIDDGDPVYIDLELAKEILGA